eukprot:TRINITY_DN46784_c0_g1_i1.p1 TRINITY_DN46784_c0_g1~~TRINITY_DN46784_c0_g1_i1.p1  ORF type:complete len:615 (+),score=283.56 TRINITY_DN46784_c0_g1_i1:65-1909(+)
MEQAWDEGTSPQPPPPPEEEDEDGASEGRRITGRPEQLQRQQQQQVALQAAYDNLRAESDQQLELLEELERELRVVAEERDMAYRDRDQAYQERDRAAQQLEEAREGLGAQDGGDNAAVRALEERRLAEEAAFEERKRNFDHIITVFAEEKAAREATIEQLQATNAALQAAASQHPQAGADDGCAKVAELEAALESLRAAAEEEKESARAAAEEEKEEMRSVIAQLESDARSAAEGSAQGRQSLEDAEEEKEALRAALRKKEQETNDLNHLIARKRRQWERWREDCHERIRAEEHAGRQRAAELESALRDSDKRLALAEEEVATLRARDSEAASANASQSDLRTGDGDSLMMTMLEEKEAELERKDEALRRSQAESGSIAAELVAAQKNQEELATALALQADDQARDRAELQKQLEEAKAESERQRSEVERLRKIVFRLEHSQGRRSPSPGTPGRRTPSQSPGNAARRTWSHVTRQPSVATRTSSIRNTTPQRVPQRVAASPSRIQAPASLCRRHPVALRRTASPSPRPLQPQVTRVRHCTPPRHIHTGLAAAPRSTTPSRHLDVPPSPCRRTADVRWASPARAGTPKAHRPPLVCAGKATHTTPLADRSVNRK